MRSKDDKVLSKDDKVIQPIGDGHIHQDREQTAGTCEEETHDKEVPIKSEPNLAFCEDLWDVLDELGEILDEEQADLALELNPEITPPPPPICLDDDTSLFTRRSNPANDRFASVVNEPLETPCKAQNSKTGELIENGGTKIIELHDSNSRTKPISSTANAVHERKPRARSRPSEDTVTSPTKRGSEAIPERFRPTSNERRSANRKKETISSSSAVHKSRSKDFRSDSDRLRNSPSQSNQNKSPVRSRESNQKRRRSKSSDRVKIITPQSHSKRRNSPIRSRGRRSISQTAKYFKSDQKRRRSKSSDRVRVRTRLSPSNSPIRSRGRSRSISQNLKYCKADQRRHRKTSNDRVRSRRRSSPRERMSRRHTSRSRSPHNMRRSDYIRYTHTERIQRRRNSSSSPRISHHISRYSLIRWPRQRSKSRSHSGRFSRSRRSRSRSPRLKFLIRNVCNNGRSNSTRRSRSRSVSPRSKLRERSRSIHRLSKVRNSPRLGSRPPKLRIQHTSGTKSPSAQSPPLLDETMTAVQVATSYQASQSGDQRLRSASPVSVSPRPIDPMITLYNRVNPASLRKQQLLTPSTPYMFYMRTDFANISPNPANLAPFDLRHRLHTSRYLGPNYLGQRIQNHCVGNTYLPPPAFNTHGQLPPGCTIDYNSNGYY